MEDWTKANGMAGRTYTVKAAARLGVPTSALSGSTTNDNGNEHSLTDTAATGSAKFYSVETGKP